MRPVESLGGSERVRILPTEPVFLELVDPAQSIELTTRSGRHIAQISLVNGNKVQLKNNETGMSFILKEGIATIGADGPMGENFFGPETRKYIHGQHCDVKINYSQRGIIIVLGDYGGANETHYQIINNRLKKSGIAAHEDEEQIKQATQADIAFAYEKEQTAILDPKKPPLSVTLGDDPFILETARGTNIGIIYYEEAGEIIFENKETNRKIKLLTGLNRIGRNYQGDDFFADPSARPIVSGDQCEITVIPGTEGQNVLKIKVFETTNGTQYRIIEDPEHLLPRRKIGMVGGTFRDGHFKSSHGEVEMISGTAGGLRKYAENQDGAYGNEDGLLVLADGMGGYGDGKNAARAALQEGHRTPKNAPMESIFTNTAKAIREANLKEGAGVTLAVMRKKDARTLEVAHAGDVKIFVISKKLRKIIYESKDQSRVQKMIDRDILKPLERYTNPQNYIITNCVTANGLQEPADIQEITCEPGDIAIAVSDGLSDFVTPEEVLDAVLNHDLIYLYKLAERRQNQINGFNLTLDGKKHHIDVNAGDNLTIAKMEF